MAKHKYDVIISIGKDCACSMYLKKNGLRQESFPFDWLTQPENINNLGNRFELILNDFENFMNKEDFKFLPKDPNKKNDNNYDYYENIKTRLYFYHDFKVGENFDDEFNIVKEKYDRRIARLYKTIEKNDKVLLIWFCHDEQNIVDAELISYGKKINNKFKKEIGIVVFQNNRSYPTDGRYDTIELGQNITKHIMRTYPENPECITRGNVTLCNKIFKKFIIRHYYYKKLKTAYKKYLAVV